MSRNYKHEDVTKDLRNASSELKPLLAHLRTTFPYGPKVNLDFGTFANVVDVLGIKIAFSIDGGGSKVMICELMNQYQFIGIDCVAMNVNDILCIGAKPLSMLDYISTEVINADTLDQIGQGLADGAKQAGVNIIGGELALLPDLLKGETSRGAIDLAGTCIGTLLFEDPIVGKNIQPGDKIIGLESSGLHSNGFTMVRKVYNLLPKTSLQTKQSILGEYHTDLGQPLGQELLIPTKIYVEQILAMLQSVEIHGLCHITGDGLLNLPRLASEVGYVIDSPPDPNPIFKLIADKGQIAPASMYEVFNMGIGFCVVVPSNQVQHIIDIASAHQTKATQIGYIVEDPERKVLLPTLGLVGSRGQGFRTTGE